MKLALYKYAIIIIITVLTMHWCILICLWDEIDKFYLKSVMS